VREYSYIRKTRWPQLRHPREQPQTFIDPYKTIDLFQFYSTIFCSVHMRIMYESANWCIKETKWIDCVVKQASVGNIFHTIHTR
jgi:hypothetical protein